MKQSYRTTSRAGLALLGLLALILGLGAGASTASTAPTFTSLYSFSGVSGNYNVNADGAWPRADLLAGADGNFYGTTAYGGANGYGTVFKITPAGKLTSLYSFSFSNDGGGPVGRLVWGSDGNLYGTTTGGGAYTYGTVFKMVTDGAAAGTKLTTVYSFGSRPADGQCPYAGLVLGGDGNFYGTTVQGGASGNGTVFVISSLGESILYSFTGGADGGIPQAALVQAPGGGLCFYGTAQSGGVGDNGTIFKIVYEPHIVGKKLVWSWDESTLHTFAGAADGAWPMASLILGSDGDLYGTTSTNGTGKCGTVFKITPAGALTTLHAFNGADGQQPLTDLVLGADGSLYGDTYWGGANGTGILFKIASAGNLTTLHSFQATLANWENPDGVCPNGGLIQGFDGSFYGTTQMGGVNGNGTVFKLTPAAGSTYALWNHSGQASLWNIPVAGSVTSASFGPYTGWTPVALSSDTSGNAYVLWTTAAGAASVWKISSSLALVTSQNFGPYSGWTAKSLAVGPDARVHVLWNHASDNEVSIFDFALGSSYTSKTYGPITGWQAAQIAVDYNNNTRILWIDAAANEAGLWNITSSGVQTSQTFGPFAGWQALSLALAPGGQPRIVWKCTSTKQASIFTIAPNGAYTSQPLGPYSGWTPAGLSVNADGDSFLMWTSASNQLSLYDIGSTGSFTSSSYGPFSGWTPVATAAGP